MRALVVEDDDLVASGIVAGLRLHMVTADRVDSARSARSALATARFDVVVLDLGLPDEDGFDLLRHWRETNQSVPILVLTARDAVEDRVKGLRAGADDYLVKPFDLDELVARLLALQRRGAGRSVDQITRGALRFDSFTREVTLRGEPVSLSRRECALLQLFLNNPNRILTAEQITDDLYGFEDGIESNAINVHIHHLRQKLGAKIVETVRGLGYRLGMPET